MQEDLINTNPCFSDFLLLLLLLYEWPPASSAFLSWEFILRELLNKLILNRFHRDVLLKKLTKRGDALYYVLSLEYPPITDKILLVVVLQQKEGNKNSSLHLEPCERSAVRLPCFLNSCSLALRSLSFFCLAPKLSSFTCSLSRSP